jgi:acyl-CoA thioester hydrolase
MERIKLIPPTNFDFSTKIKVRITDINYGNHVGNDTYLSYLHEARMQYLKHFRHTELNINGISLIMSDIAIQLKSELVYGDEFEVFVEACNFDKLGFDIFYKLVHTTTKQTIAIAKTGMVGFDYNLKKKISLPADFHENFKSVSPEGFEPSSSEPKSDILIH